MDILDEAMAADHARLQLARACAEADRACVEFDAALLARAIREAIPLAAGHLTGDMMAIIELALSDFAHASEGWRELRRRIRVRRDAESLR